MAQLRWLKTLTETENNITVLVTHDDDLFERLTQNGTIGQLKT
jgi:ABC-type lipoprotein export system ATPase subunit